MPIYKMHIAGRNKPVLVKADSAAKAKDFVVEAKALTAEEMGAALESGEKVWNGTDALPADEAAKPDETENKE